MAYTDQINSLKEALNSYSAEEEKLSALYKTAIENAEKAHQTAKAQLEAQYDIDRNAVYADNARSERNFNNLLAGRGLGFSGEAAQSKLNSNITLSNRLGELEREKNKGSLKLDNDLASNKIALSMEEAEKLKSILDSKNQLGADIAGMELDRENEANRLQFDRETEANKLAWEKESEANRLQAEKEALAQQILADKQTLADKLNAEQQALAEKLKAEQAANYAKLQADKEAKAAELQAEKDMLAIKLQAEKDMLAAELEAKYNSVVSGENSSGGSKDKNTGSNKNTSTDKNNTSGNQNSENMPFDDPSDDGGSFIPNINAPSLAKQLVNTATSGNGYVSDDEHDHIINKYLIQLREGYDIDEEYYNELIFMLKAYGYEERTYPEMRVQVITYDAEAYYDDIYDEYFEDYVMNGIGESTAQKKARETAANAQIEYLYKKSNSNLEFKECCKQMGIGNAKAQEYIEAMEAKFKVTSPSSGVVGNQTSRTGK